jgi:hypothetical protein
MKYSTRSWSSPRFSHAVSKSPNLRSSRLLKSRRFRISSLRYSSACLRLQLHELHIPSIIEFVIFLFL